MTALEWQMRRIARRLLGRGRAPAAVAVHPFDVAHGVETSGLHEAAQLGAAQLGAGHANAAHVTAYFGVPPSRFRNAIERWQATPDTSLVQNARLVDVGCGKGRAVLLASRMGFRDVYGVELYPELARIAEANLARWRAREAPLSPVTIVCGDAVATLPGLVSGPTLLYVYNPFRPPVLRALLQTLAGIQAHLTAPIDLLYLYPEHESAFGDFPQFERLWHDLIAISPEDEGDGISSATEPCSLYRLPLLPA